MIGKLGRFSAVRRFYGGMARKLAGTGFDGRGHIPLPAGPKTVFGNVSADACVGALKQDGIAPGLKLPEHVMAPILAYAETCSFREQRAGDPPRPVRLVSASVRECPEIMALLDDAFLTGVAERYLGYRPRRAEAYLEWLLAFPQGTEPEYAPYRYHFDVPGLASVAVFFFLTDVSEDTGAHCMLRRSHTKKPWRLLWVPGSATGDRAARHYDPALEYRVMGTAGSGFFEDLYSFHKVLCPRTGDRLSLQIRFS